MASPFLDRYEKTVPVVAQGSAGVVLEGYGLTLANRGSARREWVSRGTTLILGCHPNAEAHEEAKTGSAAEWDLPVKAPRHGRFEGATLVVACERRQGGLHSQVFGALARVLVNGKAVDVIGLRTKPEGHDDYFHRVPAHGPAIEFLQDQGTVYTFTVPLDFLAHDGVERIRLEVDPSVRWDIDRVVLVMRTVRRRIKPWAAAVTGGILSLGAQEAISHLLSRS